MSFLLSGDLTVRYYSVLMTAATPFNFTREVIQMAKAPQSETRTAEAGTHSAREAFTNKDKQSSVISAGALSGSRPGDTSKFPIPTSNAENMRTMDRKPPAGSLK